MKFTFGGREKPDTGEATTNQREYRFFENKEDAINKTIEMIDYIVDNIKPEYVFEQIKFGGPKQNLALAVQDGIFDSLEDAFADPQISSAIVSVKTRLLEISSSIYDEELSTFPKSKSSN